MSWGSGVSTCFTLDLLKIHNLFHVSLLRKYVPDPSHVLEYESLQVQENLAYEEAPIHIIDHKDQVLCRHVMPYVKV